MKFELINDNKFISIKQNISKEQVYELGVIQHQDNMVRLGKLVHKDYAGTVMGLKLFDKLTLETAIDSVVDNIVKDFNIGKMIEILCDSDFCFPNIGLTEAKNRSECIVVGVTCLSGSEKYRGKTFEGECLCDALWEAVKSILPEIEI